MGVGGGERETKRRKYRHERNIDCLPPIHALTGGQTCDLGMCPDQESNLQLFWCTGPCSIYCATQPGPVSNTLDPKTH